MPLDVVDEIEPLEPKRAGELHVGDDVSERRPLDHELRGLDIAAKKNRAAIALESHRHRVADVDVVIENQEAAAHQRLDPTGIVSEVRLASRKGRNRSNVVPAPTSLSTKIMPPCAVTI